MGWLSEGALDYICRRLTVPPAEAYGVATFYSMFSVRPRPAKVLHVCTDLACAARGGSLSAADALGPDISVQPSPCLGLCERAPAALLIRAGAPSPQAGRAPDPESPLRAGTPAPPATAAPRSGQGPDQAANPAPPAFEARVSGGGAPGVEDGAEPRVGKGRRGKAPAYATAVIAPATPTALAAATAAPDLAPAEPSAGAAVPQAGDPALTLLARVGVVDPASLDDYRAHGGYAALRRAFALGPAGVVREVTDAGLLGRG
ncbi:NAD(P)H-dependent oxidoreductase subunit E, partial [Streptomyces sp. NPDC054847]